jgi:hypothetical protein
MEMSNKKKLRKLEEKQTPPHAGVTFQQKVVTSLLDEMKTGNEYSSIISCMPKGLDLISEIRRAITVIEEIRKRPLFCYFANIVNPRLQTPTGINYTDDLPFCEMVDSVNKDVKSVSLMIVTPGGSAEQVAKFVNKLRMRFDYIEFILPDIAMSAGTIFCLSGDEIIMDSRAHIGPIDPQIPSRDGYFMPAQALLTVIKDIQERGEKSLLKGENPQWTDIQILNNIDAKELGNALAASDYSKELVEEYLRAYKFKHWPHHSNGQPVTETEKQERAKEIAAQLCNHGLWKTHSRGITRETAWNVCKLKMEHPESIQGLTDAIRRLWALVYWVFEKLPVVKIFISDNYSIIRGENMARRQIRKEENV